jgi:ferritin-like metal-binding protein YciE
MKSEARFEDVYQEQIKDLYDAEKQIVEALPKLIVQSSSAELAGCLRMHLDETREQVVRLDSILERMGVEPGSRKCEGMRGLLNEGEKSISKLKKSVVLDVALIAAARKVEHYEIASYGTACALAEMLGQEEALSLLQQTLDEESDADEALSEVVEGILTGDDTAEEEDAIDEEEIGEEEVER